MFKQLIKLFLVLLALVFSNIVSAQEELLAVEHGWIKEMPPGLPTLAAYMDVTNNTESSLTITGVKSSVSRIAELHQVKMDNDLMQMRKLSELVIKPEQTIQFKPASLHIMLIGVEQNLKQGDEVKIEFELKNHSSVKVIVPVKKDS